MKNLYLFIQINFIPFKVIPSRYNALMLTFLSIVETLVNPFRGRRQYSDSLFFLSFFFTASIVWALGRSNLFSLNTRCLGNRFLSWKFSVALYTISYKQLTMKKCKDLKLNSVMKSFYTQIYWYLVYGRFKERWLRINYQILKIQNGWSDITALIVRKIHKIQWF